MTLKKIASIGASLMLAIGGSLVATSPASAVPNADGIAQGPYFHNAPSYEVGSTLDLTTGNWSEPINSAEHTWYSCSTSSALTTDSSSCTLVSGGALTAAGGSLETSYTVQSSDLNRWIKVVVVATGYSGQSLPTTETASSSIRPAPEAPTFTGTPTVGSTLTASEMGSWYYCNTAHVAGPRGIDCFQIFGNMGPAMGSTFTVPAQSLGGSVVSLVGKYITVYTFSSNLAAETQLIAAEVAVTPTISGTAVVGNTLTITAGRNTQAGSWVLCTSAHATALNTVPMDCSPFGPVSNAIENRVSFVVAETVYVGTTAVSTIGKFIAYGISTFGATAMSATVAVTAAGSAEASADATDPSVDATDVAEPLPVWASNIVQSIPTLTRSLVTSGGSVALTGGDYADLKSITIGGKAVTFKVETTGNITIPVPAGEAGKTADIVIVFSGGTMVVQDAIKYVAPINVAKVGERPIAIAAGAKRITAAVADQIRQAAFANTSNNTISCVAYAANNTAKAKAAAKLTAVQACGIATKANPALKAAEISVIVNKAKAKKEAVGIKVYKADN